MKLILSKIKNKVSFIIKILYFLIFTFSKIKNFAKNKNNVFFIYTPTHGNLGDHTIAISVNKLLNNLNVNFMEITLDLLFYLNKFNRINILNRNTLIINGGGNLGTLWFNLEQLTREIIKNCPNSKIIIMPNTIYYENNEWGQEELRKSIEIYNNHKKLKIYAREKFSYDFMKDIYNDVKLFPDMVLYLNEYKETKRINLCLLCLRSDIEKTLKENEKKSLENNVKIMFDNNYKYTDMCVKYNIKLKNRNEEVNKKFEEFREATLVITDRLHGMIFAAITGTPCIVINSKSPKVKGCYDWIKDLEYVKFSKNIEDVLKLWNEMKDKKYIYDNKMFLCHYENLKKDIIEFIREK